MVDRFLNYTCSDFLTSVRKEIGLVLLAAMALSDHLCYAGSTNDLASLLNNESITWDGPTNGFWTGVSVYPPHSPALVNILILSSNKAEGFAYVLPSKKNSYTLELRDANGKTLVAYGEKPPKIVPSKELRRSSYSGGGSGVEYNYFLLGQNALNQFTVISISDLYRVKEGEDYILIVCPVLYKFQTNRNFLDRIDLPSVSAKIHLERALK